MPVEIIDFHESKFWIPDKEFTDTLQSMGLKEINGEKELVLNFGEDTTQEEPIPKDLVIRGMKKLKEDGHISDFFQLGKLIQSARKLGIKPMLLDNGELTFTPSIVGKQITMTPVNIREVVKEDKKVTYRDWVITAVQGLGTSPQQQKTAATPAPKADPSAMTEKWKEFLAENLTTPTKEAGIIKLCNDKIPDAAARKPYSETRKSALVALVNEKFLTIDGDGKYSVA